MMQKQHQQRKQHRHNSLLMATIAVILLGTLITPTIMVDNAQAVNMSELTVSAVGDNTATVTWTVSGLAGTSYSYDVYVTPMGGNEECKASGTGETAPTKSVDLSALTKGTSHTVRVVITDDTSLASVSKTTTFSTTGAVGIAAVQAVFWNAYAALVAIVWLICIGIAAYYMAKRAKEEDDRVRGKDFQYALEAILTGVIISILPLIAAMAQGWVQT